MPVTCPLDIRPLAPDEFEQRDYAVMGCAFAAQNELGRLCEEDAYQRDLQARLREKGFRHVEIEVPIRVSHGDFSKEYLLDLVVDHAVYELKTVAALTPEHQAQLLNYLFLLEIPRGKLINFRTPKVQGHIHASPLSSAIRRKYRIEMTRWQDCTPQCRVLRQMLPALLADWGAFLDFHLYEQALTHFLGGEERLNQRLPLHRRGIALGTQEFHVHARGAAFEVTAVTEMIDEIEMHLRRLLALTDLHVLQWINLNQAEIQMVTLRK